MNVHETLAKSALHRTKIPGADWVINHYVGCEHACVYCYARYVCKWRKHDEKWGEFVDVRVNTPELVAREALGKSGTVTLCSVSDAYQPVESRYELTRRVLEALPGNFKITVLTKSPLILRDADLFGKFRDAELGLTITTLDNRIARIFEPRAPLPRARLRALMRLKDEGFKTFAFIGPVLPYLTDVEEIVDAVAPYVNEIMVEDLNFGPARKEIMKTIREHFPELEWKYAGLTRSYWIGEEKKIREIAKKYGVVVKTFFRHAGTLRF